jgi:hypothetical protein
MRHGVLNFRNRFRANLSYGLPVVIKQRSLQQHQQSEERGNSSPSSSLIRTIVVGAIIITMSASRAPRVWSLQHAECRTNKLTIAVCVPSN